MPIAKGSDFTPLPPGTHQARCFAVIDLGTQHSETFADAYKILIMWETPHERVIIDKEERPMTIHKEYSLTLAKRATLRKHLETWRGRPFTKEELEGFEVANVIGAPCLLSVVHTESANGNTYAKIEAVSAIPKGMEVMPLFHKTAKYDLADGDNEAYKALPEWIQKKIKASEERSPNRPVAETRPEQEREIDDVPF